jgi:hypothetical protein
LAEAALEAGAKGGKIEAEGNTGRCSILTFRSGYVGGEDQGVCGLEAELLHEQVGNAQVQYTVQADSTGDALPILDNTGDGVVRQDVVDPFDVDFQRKCNGSNGIGSGHINILTTEDN